MEENIKYHMTQWYRVVCRMYGTRLKRDSHFIFGICTPYAIDCKFFTHCRPNHHSTTKQQLIERKPEEEKKFSLHNARSQCLMLCNLKLRNF